MKNSEWALRGNNLLRFTSSAMKNYTGNRHVSIKVDNKKLILSSEGYDATLSKDCGGAHFSVTKLEKIVEIPKGIRFETETYPNMIIVHLDREVKNVKTNSYLYY